MTNYLMLVLIFLTSFSFSTIFLNSLIKICNEKKLFDEPITERKIHKTPIPNIAGFAFFFTLIFQISLYGYYFKYENSIIKEFSAIIILFLIGICDDLIGLSSTKRFLLQILAGLIIVVFADFRILNLSIIGYSSISNFFSILVSLVFFIMITNAYNLIDGVNGLLGSLSILAFTCFSFFFYYTSNYFLLAFTISMIASLYSFLLFNFGNASIFMGSSGSYIIGALIYSMSVLYLNQKPIYFLPFPRFSLLFSIVSIPFYDTIRVFMLRIFENKSPFSADANHIHHRLLKLNLSHKSVVFVLILSNIFLIIFNILFIKSNDFFTFISSLLVLFCLNFILEYKIKLIK